jgi:hypothetical protein
LTTLQFIALCLASMQVVDVWNQGSIFADARRRVADRALVGRASFFDRVLDCWYCSSHWAPIGLVVIYALIGWTLIYALAATRVVCLTNMLLPKKARFEYKDPA